MNFPRAEPTTPWVEVEDSSSYSSMTAKVCDAFKDVYFNVPIVTKTFRLKLQNVYSLKI